MTISPSPHPILLCHPAYRHRACRMGSERAAGHTRLGSDGSGCSTTSIDDLPLPDDSQIADDSPEFWRFITAVRSVCLGWEMNGPTLRWSDVATGMGIVMGWRHMECPRDGDGDGNDGTVCRGTRLCRRRRWHHLKNFQRSIMEAMTCVLPFVPMDGQRIGSTLPCLEVGFHPHHYSRHGLHSNSMCSQRIWEVCWSSI